MGGSVIGGSTVDTKSSRHRHAMHNMHCCTKPFPCLLTIGTHSQRGHLCIGTVHKCTESFALQYYLFVIIMTFKVKLHSTDESIGDTGSENRENEKH